MNACIKEASLGSLTNNVVYQPFTLLSADLYKISTLVVGSTYALTIPCYSYLIQHLFASLHGILAEYELSQTTRRLVNRLE